MKPRDGPNNTTTNDQNNSETHCHGALSVMNDMNPDPRSSCRSLNRLHQEDFPKIELLEAEDEHR